MSSLEQNNQVSKVCIINDLSGYSTSNQVQKVSVESMTATNIIDCSVTGTTTMSGDVTINGTLTVNASHNITTSPDYTLSSSPTSRSLGTTYGATSTPVHVYFASAGTGGNFYYEAVASISPDNATWYVIGRARVEWTSTIKAGQISFALPSGWYYKIEKTGESGTPTENLTYYEIAIS